MGKGTCLRSRSGGGVTHGKVRLFSPELSETPPGEKPGRPLPSAWVPRAWVDKAVSPGGQSPAEPVWVVLLSLLMGAGGGTSDRESQKS